MEDVMGGVGDDSLGLSVAGACSVVVVSLEVSAMLSSFADSAAFIRSNKQ